MMIWITIRVRPYVYSSLEQLNAQSNSVSIQFPFPIENCSKFYIRGEMHGPQMYNLRASTPWAARPVQFLDAKDYLCTGCGHGWSPNCSLANINLHGDASL